jgi:serine/threonine protein kinase/tetratricopeptide (TPR) repeat protein
MTEQSLFLAVLEIADPVKRATYLDEACAGEPVLRSRVEHLLQAHEVASEFMTRPAAALVAAEGEEGAISEGAGTSIGPYKLVEQIGEGGFGVVFMAEQLYPVRRPVALKVLKPGMDTRQVVARFEAERQALALMDHANIARVFDGGTTESGRPYFVMELVHGVPITRYCDDNHLTPRERLELFVPVCQAIQHAHQKGIIHRDIKPSNVMVTLYDGKPVPKVIDFGVAKATEQKLTERTLVTQYGTMVGTLEYMSPEQAEMSALGVDTRSDIYSLGVLLYELLTGSTPLSHKRVREASYGEILRMIKEEDPPRPSTRLSDTGDTLASISAQRRTEPAKLAKLMRGELDWIVMKCLEKDRNRRYETASAFAADVQRYLNDEPVLACPPSRGYRLRKFARRNRAGVIAAGLVLVTLVAGIVGTSMGLVEAKKAEADAIGERNEKQTALDKLVAEQKKTREALAAQTRARRQAYSALRTLNDDMVMGVLTRQRQLGATEKAYLRKIANFFDQLAREYGDGPEAWAIQSDGYWLVGGIWVILGEAKDAEAAFRNALAVQMRLVAHAPGEPKYRAAAAACHIELGKQFAKAGQGQQAENSFREGIAILTRLASVRADDPNTSFLLADSHNDLGLLLRAAGRLPEAEAAFREGLSAGVRAAADPRAKFYYRAIVASCHDHLAHVLAQTGRLKESESAHREAIVLRLKLSADFPDEAGLRREIATSHLNLGIAFAQTGRIREAEVAFGESIALSRKLTADYPLVPNYRESLAAGLANLGTLLTQTGRARQAEAILREALELQRRLAADFPDTPNPRPELAAAHFNLGTVFAKSARTKEAEAAFREAIDLQKKLVANSPDMPTHRRGLSRSYGNLGVLLSDVGRNEEAEAAYRDALALDRRLAADFPLVLDHAVALAGTNCNLGSLFQSTGQAAKALAWYDKAITGLEPVLAKGPRLAKARLFLRNGHAGRAQALEKLDRHGDALKDWDRAVELSPPSQRPMVQMERALCLAKAGEPARATQAAEEVIAAANLPAGVLYDAGCVFALAAAAVNADATLREKYAARAVGILGRAQAAGFFRQPGKVAHMKKDTDLDALRQRADFKKLLAELER